ncbi:MAG TPA: PIN domain-containing protein [Luteitalea sp.]|nr:PIN domain-containing protein [Luteitalea sp.]
MILVDTSVWVRFLANQAPFAAELDRLLLDGGGVGHEYVYGELLLGDRGGRRALLESYAQMTHASPVPHPEVVAFIRARGFHGRGIGWVDAHLLASALVAGGRLWTADRALATIADECGIAYRILDSTSR